MLITRSRGSVSHSSPTLIEEPATNLTDRPGCAGFARRSPRRAPPARKTPIPRVFPVPRSRGRSRRTVLQTAWISACERNMSRARWLCAKAGVFRVRNAPLNLPARDRLCSEASIRPGFDPMAPISWINVGPPPAPRLDVVNQLGQGAASRDPHHALPGDPRRPRRRGEVSNGAADTGGGARPWPARPRRDRKPNRSRNCRSRSRSRGSYVVNRDPDDATVPCRRQQAGHGGAGDAVDVGDLALAEPSR